MSLEAHKRKQRLEQMAYTQKVLRREILKRSRKGKPTDELETTLAQLEVKMQALTALG